MGEPAASSLQRPGAGVSRAGGGRALSGSRGWVGPPRAGEGDGGGWGSCVMSTGGRTPPCTWRGERLPASIGAPTTLLRGCTPKGVTAGVAVWAPTTTKRCRLSPKRAADSPVTAGASLRAPAGCAGLILGLPRAHLLSLPRR